MCFANCLVFSQTANNTLSNLASPTSVNQSLIPGTDNTLNLGLGTQQWKNLYLSGNLYLHDFKFISDAGTLSAYFGRDAGGTGTGSENTGIGDNSMFSLIGGSYNSAVGSSALFYNVSGNYNTVIGWQAMYLNTAGNSNIAIGAAALHDNTNKSNNIAIGDSSLYKNGTGASTDAQAIDNIAIGTKVMFYNTKGSDNTVVGNEAMKNTKRGSQNSVFGSMAMQLNVDGTLNCAFGYSTMIHNYGSANNAFGANALFSNATGTGNCAFGTSALYYNSRSYNTAFGNSAMHDNTTGQFNVGIGYSALLYNTTGSYNVALGSYSLMSNTTAGYNTSVGYKALYTTSAAPYNTALGYEALYNTSNGYNTGVGYMAGATNHNDSNCSFFGYNADQEVDLTYTNSMALGNSSRINANNQVRVGNASVTSIGGYADWTNISDGRYKKNIQQNVPGLAFIRALQPVTYTLDVNGIAKFLGEDISGENGNAPASVQDERDVKSKIIYSGFIAQDVENAAQKIGYDFSGVDIPQDDNGLYGLRYAEFVVPLVKAVQELDSANSALSNENEGLKSRLDNLDARVQELEAMLAAGNSDSNDGMVKLSAQDQDAAILGQNLPNPFGNSTVIPFRIPGDCRDATIVITETASGKILRAIPVACGETQLSIDAGFLAGGTYSYSLYVDGQLIATKQMIIAK